MDVRTEASQLPPPEGDGLRGVAKPMRNEQEKTGD